ncbi:MAG: PD-(D/E)XK nuclease family protein [Spirochaetes bacterium]|nr:PD-(D/E)XK nuclease family protein [Spirochaetota bacterium]
MLRFAEVEALETDRFMSWDSFLAQGRRDSVPKGKLQADPSYRLLWASAFLERQAEASQLQRLVKPGLKPPASLALSLAELAPRLPSLIKAAAAMPDPPPGWSGETLADSRRLSADYASFLDRQGLYEASWLPLELKDGQFFLAFWPSLYPGFAELKGRLLDSGRFECFGCAAEGFSPNDCVIRRYSSTWEELSSVFSICRSFIDEGMRPGDIVLSLPNLDPATKAYLGSFAQNRGLPLAYRSGEPLSSYPFGSLLSSVHACLGEGFSLRTLRSLLEPRPFAWKRKDELTALLRFGGKYRIPEAAFEPRETIALWKESLRVLRSEDASLLSLFPELASAAEVLRSARSFAALRAALHDFRRTFLDEKGLPKAALETMERIFVEIDAFDACETRLGGEMPKRGRFDLLLSALESTIYAPPDSRESAISVYTYQVGALVAAPLHFVLDLSQESTQMAKLHFTGLPRELIDYNGEGVWNEAELLSALGAAGAVYCHAKAGITGCSVPHPFLLSTAGTEIESQPWRLEPSADELETAAWAVGDPGALPLRLPGWAKRGAARGCKAATHSARSAADTAARKMGKISGPSGRSLDSHLLLTLSACDAHPDFKFSPARLKDIGLCPFRWFASCVPGVEAPFQNPALAAEGNLTHALIGALLGEIAARDGKVEEMKIEEYLSIFDGLFSSKLESVLRKEGPVLRVALELLQPKLRARIAGLLAAETRFEREGWEIGEFEVTLSNRYEPYGIRLEGRADRLASTREITAGGGEPLFALIDYKKNKTPAKKDFLVDDKGKLADYQLASYASILASQGKKMGTALYWSVETSKTLAVFGQGKERPDWDSFAPERGALDAALAEASSILSNGRFLDTKPTSKTCKDCGFRPICRAHFSSERL